MFFDSGGQHFSIAIHDQSARSAGPNIYSEKFDEFLRAFRPLHFGFENKHPMPRLIPFNKLF
jgi:hypothetical protein